MQWSLQFDDLSHPRHGNLEPKAFLDLGAKNFSRVILSMGQRHVRLARCRRAQPVQQILLAGVSTEPAEGVNMGAHGHLHALNCDMWVPVHKPSTLSTGCASNDGGFALRCTSQLRPESCKPLYVR